MKHRYNALGTFNSILSIFEPEEVLMWQVRALAVPLLLAVLAGCAAITDSSTVSASISKAPVIIHGFGATGGAVYPGAAHAGVDVAGVYGAPVRAVADGEVVYLITETKLKPSELIGSAIPRIYNSGCGNGLVIAHRPFKRYTLYCHLANVNGEILDAVRSNRSFPLQRGDAIGRVGQSGNASGVNVPPHVHLELCTIPCWGSNEVRAYHEDPTAVLIGCYNPAQSYPVDRLVLTSPTC